MFGLLVCLHLVLTLSIHYESHFNNVNVLRLAHEWLNCFNYLCAKHRIFVDVGSISMHASRDYLHQVPSSPLTPEYTSTDLIILQTTRLVLEVRQISRFHILWQTVGTSIGHILGGNGGHVRGYSMSAVTPMSYSPRPYQRKKPYISLRLNRCALS